MQPALRERNSAHSPTRVSAHQSHALVVVHGAGRGPHLPFSPSPPSGLLPEPHSKLAIWKTGTPKPSLNGVSSVLFLLSDRLRERYSECYADATELAEHARRRGIPVFNPPEALSNTVKSVQSRLWREASLPTPAVHPFRNTMEMRDAALEVAFPALLRADSLHANSRTRIVASRQHLHDMDPEEIDFPASLTPLLDVRQGYASRDPGSAFERFHHVKQAVVFGDQVWFAHLYFSPGPIVHPSTATIGPCAAWNPFEPLVRLWWRRHAHLDEQFAHDGEPDAGLFRRAVRVLGLDCAVIHYSTLAGGRTILWKAHTDLRAWPIRRALIRSSFHTYLNFLSHP